MFDVNPSHHDLRIREINRQLSADNGRPGRKDNGFRLPVGAEGLFSIVVISAVILGNAII